MLKVLSYILCDLDPKVKVIGQKAGICDGVPSTSALVLKTDARKSRSRWSLNCICTDSVTPRRVHKPNLGFLGFMLVTRFF